MEDSATRHPDIRPLEFTSLHGLGDPERIDIRELWLRRPSGIATVPVGLTQAGTLVELTIPAVAKRNWGGGFGHGLVTGAADAGRAELIRAIVLGLAIKNSPTAVNFFFVDFHGRGTFNGLADLPHTTGLVSDLTHDPGLAESIVNDLTREYKSRLELLHTGNFGDLEDYEGARNMGARLDPIPSLIIVIDGLAELLAQQPEFRKLLAIYGRVGRVIGAHLLLAAQPEETLPPEFPDYVAYHLVLESPSSDGFQTVPTDAHIKPCYLRIDTESVRFAPVQMSPVHRPAIDTEVPFLEMIVAQMSRVW